MSQWIGVMAPCIRVSIVISFITNNIYVENTIYIYVCMCMSVRVRVRVIVDFYPDSNVIFLTLERQ